MPELEGRRAVASHASESDYAPLARTMLWKLGYAVLPPEEVSAPELRVVREERLGDLPAELDGAPIVLIGGTRRRAPSDARVIGRVRRPADVHALYRLFQSALEDHPRAVPRVPTSLEARALRDGQRWDLEVRSLSENGCLVTGAKLPGLGTLLTLEIVLPWGERIGGPAAVAYEQGESIGCVFHGITLRERQRVAKAVGRLIERL